METKNKKSRRWASEMLRQGGTQREREQSPHPEGLGSRKEGQRGLADSSRCAKRRCSWTWPAEASARIHQPGSRKHSKPCSWQNTVQRPFSNTGFARRKAAGRLQREKERKWNMKCISLSAKFPSASSPGELQKAATPKPVSVQP